MNSQETFQDSRLAIKWEIFPFLGKTWYKKFLFGDNYGKHPIDGFLLGKYTVLSLVFQFWENSVNI